MSQSAVLDPGIIPHVEPLAAWALGALVMIVGAVLHFGQKLVFRLLEKQVDAMRQEIAELRKEMLGVMAKSLDAANGKAPSRRKPPD